MTKRGNIRDFRDRDPRPVIGFNKAHETNRRSKNTFVCQKCEYELNADYNASKNIARKLLKRLHSGPTSSDGGAPCQCALTSGTLTLNGEFIASVDSTAEDEFTDKPTMSVVSY